MGGVCCCQDSSSGAAMVETDAKTDAITIGRKMTVMIVGAKGIRNSDWLPGLGKPDCYCTATVAGKQLYKTKTIDNSLAPEWSEEFDVELGEEQQLEFGVYDSDLVGADFLGKVSVKSQQVMEDGLNNDFLMEDAGANVKAYLGIKIKLQGQEYPEKAVEVEVALEKGEAADYGIMVDDQDKLNLQVCEIYDGGVLQQYNDSAKDDMKVKVSDFIVGVNGVRGDPAEMLTQFGQAKVTVHLRRARDFTTIIEKKDKASPLGMVIPKPPVKNALVILDVGDGLLKEYNDKCKNEADKIMKFDRIVSVKGETGTASQIRAKLMDMSGKFQIGIQRRC